MTAEDQQLSSQNPDKSDASWRAVFTGQRGRLIIGLLFLELAAAMHSLTVATLLPSITEDLGGEHYFGWAVGAGTLSVLVMIPLSAAVAERIGRRRMLALALVIYCVGALATLTAPTLPMFVVGRLLQGAASGALAVFSLGAVASTVPSHLRSRVYGLIASMWVVPAFIGPPYAVAVNALLGWRWTLFMFIPILLLGRLLIAGQTAAMTSRPVKRSPIPAKAISMLVIGTLAVLTGTSFTSLAALAAAGLGLVIIGFAIVRLLPADTTAASRASIVAMLFLAFTYFSIEGTLSLLVTRAIGSGLAQAGLALSVGTLCWALASMTQPKLTERWKKPDAFVAAVGAAMLTVATGGLIAVLAARGSGTLGVTVVVVSCAVAGLGMGAAYPTVMTTAMEPATDSSAERLSANLVLAETVGGSLGPIIGGSLYSLGLKRSMQADSSLTISYGASALAAVLLLCTIIAVNRRLNRPLPEPATTH
ncbi:MFS transporter [Streptomyces boninensis]|uniref:MFS transporter n=1 Tax=Streptomyces boninensis TaxID=2039455 RepID=UPI003B20D83C